MDRATGVGPLCHGGRMAASAKPLTIGSTVLGVDNVARVKDFWMAALDYVPPTQAAEVERLIGLGAKSTTGPATATTPTSRQDDTSRIQMAAQDRRTPSRSP